MATAAGPRSLIENEWERTTPSSRCRIWCKRGLTRLSKLQKKKISQSVTEDEVNEKGKYEYEYDQPVHRHGWARAVE